MGPSWQGTPFGYDDEANLFITKTRQLGTPYTRINPETLKGEAVFNTSENKQMVRDLQTLVKDKLMITKSLLGGYTSDAFTNQQIMMTVGSTGGSTYNVPKDDLFEVGVSKIPQETKDKETHQSILQGPSIVFFAKGVDSNGFNPSDKDINEMIASWEFYKFITRPEETIRQAIGTGYLPVKNSSYETDLYKNYINNIDNNIDKVKADSLTLSKQLMEDNNFFVTPAYVNSSKARKAVGELLERAFANDDSLDSIFRRAIYEANK